MTIDELILALQAVRLAYGGEMQTIPGERWSHMHVDSRAEWTKALAAPIEFGVVRAHALQVNVLVFGR